MQTNEGVKAIDVVWVSRERHKQKPRSSTVHPLAPEICMEVFSPSNTRAEIDAKMRLYFERGAQEYWTRDGKGGMKFFRPERGDQAVQALPEVSGAD